MSSEQTRQPEPATHGGASVAEALVVLRQPAGPLTERLRALATRLTLGAEGRTARTLAVVSPEAGDGRSFLAANLAALFALSGRRTLLVDADFRNPRQHRLFRADAAPGLSELLRQEADRDVMQPVADIPGLHLVAAGRDPAVGIGHLTGQHAAGLFTRLFETCDQVVIDTPPALAYADAQAACAHADAALLLARRGHTRLADLRRIADDLQAVDTRVLGAVINDL